MTSDAAMRRLSPRPFGLRQRDASAALRLREPSILGREPSHLGREPSHLGFTVFLR